MTRRARIAALGLLPLALLLVPLLVERGGEAPRDESPAPSLVPGWSRVVPGARFRAPEPLVAKAMETVEERESLRAADGEVLVAVRDERGRPVVDALVAVEGAEPVRADAEGVADVRLGAARADARLIVSADGYRRHVRALPEPAPEPVQVELALGGTLTGVARWADGTPAEGAAVLCWPQGEAPSVSEVVRARDGGATDALTVARAGADGAFRLQGLEPAERYALGACLRGGATLERVRDRRPGDIGIELVVEPLVAAALELVDENGGPPRACSGMFGEPVVWDPDAPTLAPAFLPEDSPQVAWIGGAELARFARGGRDHYLMTYQVLSGPTKGRGGTFSAHVPGYAPAWTSVALEPLSPELRPRALRLTPAADAWGSLELELIDAEGWLSSRLGADAESLGTLRLVETETLVAYEVLLPPSDEARWTFDGIPAGRYRVRLALRDWSTSVPMYDAPDVVVDVNAEGAHARLSLAGRGAGEVVVSSADGSDYEGELLLLVQQDGPSRFVRFRSAPYVLGGLEEGAYDVHVTRVGARNLAAAPSARLWLAEGTVSACMVHLP